MDMKVGLGSTDPKSNTRKWKELEDNVCGPDTKDDPVRLSTYCCGPRIYDMPKKLLILTARFLTFEADLREVEVYSLDKKKIGLYELEIDTWLEWYPRVKSTYKFGLELTLC